MSKPITKIIITLPSQDALKDIWKLFDYVITKMEELGSDGMPKVGAQGRKKFRVEVMRASEEQRLEVFSRWVTLLVPEMVPATPSLIQRVVGPPNMTDVAALEQAASINQEEKEREQEAVRKAAITEKHRMYMLRAREAKGNKVVAGVVKKSHHKKKVEG